MVKLVYDISIVNGVYESIYNWGGTTWYIYMNIYHHISTVSPNRMLETQSILANRIPLYKSYLIIY